jgi:Lrp/AsnC family leucine-responsive transcriptional regulator
VQRYYFSSLKGLQRWYIGIIYATFLKYSVKYSKFAEITAEYRIIFCKKLVLNMETLDRTDILILRELQKDAKLTTKELAAKVNLSPSPVFERQKRLEKEGYIKKYVAVVDPIKAGNGIMVLCNVRLKHHSKEFSRQFTSVIAEIDEVVECFNTSGDYDYQLKIYARSMQDYQEFVLGTLGDLDCIGSLHSIFVIGEVKNTLSVPLKA